MDVAVVLTVSLLCDAPATDSLHVLQGSQTAIGDVIQRESGAATTELACIPLR
jgi:hypothetical protein